MTAQERDRIMQVHLAQARGPVRNAELTRSLVNLAIRMQAARTNGEANLMLNDPIIETLATVVRALEAANVQYAITGSLASSVHGEPVSSVDADLVILASPLQAEALSENLTPRFYAPADMLRGAAESHGFVNVVDNATSVKVDLSFVPTVGFLAHCLKRRVQAAFGPDSPAFWFVTPEDVILMKLLWRKDTQSAKQWENALSVARVKGVRMDWKYLFEQAEILGIKEDLIKLRDEAGI